MARGWYAQNIGWGYPDLSYALRIVRCNLKNPAKTIEEYLNTLEAQGLTQTASVLREYGF